MDIKISECEQEFYEKIKNAIGDTVEIVQLYNTDNHIVDFSLFYDNLYLICHPVDETFVLYFGAFDSFHFKSILRKDYILDAFKEYQKYFQKSLHLEDYPVDVVGELMAEENKNNYEKWKDVYQSIEKRVAFRGNSLILCRFRGRCLCPHRGTSLP